MLCFILDAYIYCFGSMLFVVSFSSVVFLPFLPICQKIHYKNGDDDECNGGKNVNRIKNNKIVFMCVDGYTHL